MDIKVSFIAMNKEKNNDILVQDCHRIVFDINNKINENILKKYKNNYAIYNFIMIIDNICYFALDKFEEDITIEKLYNDLIKFVEKWENNEIVLHAILSLDEEIYFSDLVNINPNNFILLEEVSTPFELGCYYSKDKPKNYISYEEYGKELMRKLNGIFTSYGYLYYLNQK